MHIQLLSVGRRMPHWVDEGVAEYAKRLPPSCALSLVEIEPAQRGKGGQRGRPSDAERERVLAAEGRRLLKAVPASALAIALDVRGKRWSTETLAAELRTWLASGQDIALMVGGADGLHASCLERAQQRWSLSALTFPHGLVRVILAEQIYRAWSILQGHPYHRGAE